MLSKIQPPEGWWASSPKRRLFWLLSNFQALIELEKDESKERAFEDLLALIISRIITSVDFDEAFEQQGQVLKQEQQQPIDWASRAVSAHLRVLEAGIAKGVRDAAVRYDPEAVKEAMRQTHEMVRGISDTLTEELRRAAHRAWVEGLGRQGFEKKIREVWPEVSRSRARTIARTEWRRASEIAKLSSFLKRGIQWVVWNTAGDARVCPYCRAQSARGPQRLQGGLGNQVMRIAVVYPPGHPNCRCNLTGFRKIVRPRTPPPPIDRAKVFQVDRRTFEEKERELMIQLAKRLADSGSVVFTPEFRQAYKAAFTRPGWVPDVYTPLENLAHLWGGGGGSAERLLLLSRASRVLGVPLELPPDYKVESYEEILRRLGPEKAKVLIGGIDEWIKAVYEQTQEYLESQGIGPDDTVLLARGLATPEEIRGQTRMALLPLNSFSTSLQDARSWAESQVVPGKKPSVLISAVPRKKVFMTFVQSKLLDWDELIVIGGWHEVVGLSPEEIKPDTTWEEIRETVRGKSLLTPQAGASTASAS